GRIVVHLSGVLFQRASVDALAESSAAPLDDWLYELRWQPAPGLVPPTVTDLPAQSPLSLDNIRRTVEERLPPLAVEHALARHRKLIDELERLSIGYVSRAFEQLAISFE